MRKARFTEHQIIAVLKSVEAGRTITMFCMLKGVINQAVTALPELLADVYHIKPVTPGIPAAAGDTEHPAHR